MKTLFLKFLPILGKSTLTLFFVLLVSTSFAQEVKFSTENGIQLNETKALQYSWQAHFSDNQSLARSSENYLNAYNTQLTTIRIDEEKNTFTILIELRMKPEWTITDWNAYLKQIHTNKKSLITNN